MFVAASVAMLVATQYYSAYDVDREARARVERVVSNGLAKQFDDISRKAEPQTYWDDAVINLDNRFDRKWAHEFIGSFFWQSDHFEHALVVDRHDRLIYAMDRGDDVAPSRLAHFSPVIAPLVRTVRHDERRHARAQFVALADGARLQPVKAHAIRRVGNRIFILSATLVQPDAVSRPLTSRSAIVVLAKEVDSVVIAALADRFLLADAVLHIGSAHREEDRAQAVLRDPGGEAVATLEWTPPKPGSQLLRKLWPAMLLFSVLLAAFVAWLMIKARTMARQVLASEARSSHLAFHDALTGLPNRALIEERFAAFANRHRREGEAFAVHCIDLDQFKAVNDGFGHLAGDELLRIVSRTLASACRTEDFLARFGGDEFTILQANATPERAAALADRIIALLQQPIELRVGRVFIGASIGIVLAGSARPDDVQECLRKADLALYRAKDEGRGRYAFFEPALDRDVKRRQQMQIELHDALTRNELRLHYQPQVDQEGTIIGMEALARWNHATLGAVSPTDFVAVAEETGLIDALGMFVLRQAFADSARWPQLTVAINVSAVQLRLPDFADRVAALLVETGVAARRFELEITERVLLGDDPQTHASLKRLRDMGFTITLDDFGTGYSSLSYLQRYPIDKVKIDRSFVARVGIDRRAEAVVVAIVRLARALGLDVIAEGVETEAQRLALKVAGCPDVQGYLTGYPIPADLMAARLAGVVNDDKDEADERLSVGRG